ncbi:hypothetical protein SAMN04487910_3422 [Aquimarina amphilecti]|uniref:Uncharacterized protein n=1 Tax=Aquimarina amphilecti TaxID=1038014 RepID=A0A1H7TGZ1_AQUAM|nr:DUF5995 family protein [Aquimarina amphilecti]SEL83759.1 hypothetical protein SAMN04487910_3422 [Aquimarina amphilecti]
MKPITTIDDVIASLDDIIKVSQVENDSLGYFAALYRRVTIKVKEGIENDFFDNGPRMAKLDVVFASRYLEAYFSYKDDEIITISWQIAFDLSTDYWPIVLQHLLIGMNAHINLDLGIAAAEVSQGTNIENLKGDFDKINEILSSLVIEVQNDLASIWPTLKKILSLTSEFDDFLVDFSMELARDGAWEFARKINSAPDDELVQLIEERDLKVASKASIITDPGLIANIILGVIRIGERGSVGNKIKDLIS